MPAFFPFFLLTRLTIFPFIFFTSDFSLNKSHFQNLVSFLALQSKAVFEKFDVIEKGTKIAENCNYQKNSTSLTGCIIFLENNIH